MRLRRLTLLVVVLVGALAASLSATAGNRAAPTPAPAFSADESVAPSGDNWLGYNGNAYNQRYSTLSEINVANVKNLKIAWRTEMQLPGLKLKKGETNFAEMTPIAYEGTLYMPDGRGNPWAIDGSSGERIWANKLPKTKLVGLAAFGLLNRGAAVGDGKVYLAAPDATIAAYNQLTGRLVWKKKMADPLGGHSFTNAVTYVNGKILTGSSGGDAGAPAFVTALDAKTGKEQWRFQVIPQKPSDPGWDTWPAKRAFNGGGAMWNQMSVDPELGIVYGVTGNPIPYSGLRRGAGDELFTDSIVALDVNTGKLKWYFQTTHHDIWDYDATNATILFDLNGKKMLAHASKFGYVFILDRETGKPVYGIPEVKVPTIPGANLSPTQPIPVGDKFSITCPNKQFFAGEVDRAKKPFARIGCLYEPYDDKGTTLTAPGALGGANWPPSAYSPDTGYMYICSKDSYMTVKSVPADKQKLTALGDFGQWDGGALADPKSKAGRVDGRLVAMNMRNNKIAWQVKWPRDMCYSGVAVTAGNLVFVGRNTGFLEAYNAKTGALVWKSPKLKAGVNAAPAIYTANGKQYVAVHAGGNSIAGLVGVKPMLGASLYAFSLPG
jgi:quinohemoprotein ethanol dehydrogenase